MQFESRFLVTKTYSTEKLCENWFPLVPKDNSSDLPNSTNLPKDLETYDIVYAIQEDNSSSCYGYFAWKDELGEDNITHRFTLEKVVLDNSFDVNSVGVFFIGIISSLTIDTQHEYRIKVDRLEMPYKHYFDNTKTEIELCSYLQTRLQAEKNGTVSDILLKQIYK